MHVCLCVNISTKVNTRRDFRGPQFNPFVLLMCHQRHDLLKFNAAKFLSPHVCPLLVNGIIPRTGKSRTQQGKTSFPVMSRAQGTSPCLDLFPQCCQTLLAGCLLPASPIHWLPLPFSIPCGGHQWAPWTPGSGWAW